MTVTATRFRSLFSFFAACLALGLLASPPDAHAQPPNSFELDFTEFCTVFDEIPQTEGVRSTLAEEWINEQWAAQNRLIVNRTGGGSIDNIIFQERASGNWVNEIRALFAAEGNQEICTFQEWVDTANSVSAPKVGSWEDRTRITRTITDGDVTEILTESWNEDANDWMFATKSTLSYDEDGNLEEQLNEAWNPDTNEWMISGRILNTYTDGKLTERLEQTRVGSDWIDDRLTTNEYNNDGTLHRTILQTRPLFGLQLENDTRTTYTYGSNVITAVDDTWTGIAWAQSARTTTQLNAEGLPTEEIEDSWNGSSWTRISRIETSYITIEGALKILTILEQACSSDCVAASAKIAWENTDLLTFSYSEVLPVELTSFTVTASDRDALLRWETASETNNAGFEVQRRLSADRPFEAIGFVDGAGTTTAPQRYRFTDAGLPFAAATVTYRLKQIDFDGAFEYSPQVELRVGGADRLVLHGTFPNPARTQATIRYELPTAGPVRLDVYNLLGQRIQSLIAAPQPAGRHEISFDASGLSSGVYFVRLQTANRALTRRMTVVQ